MVLASGELEAARIVLRLEHDLVSNLVRLAVLRQVEVGLSDDDLLTIADHVDLELRLDTKCETHS